MLAIALSAIAMSVAHSPLQAQSTGIKYGQNHPDGSLGHLTIHSQFGYSSLSGDSPRNISDFQEVELQINWIANSLITPTVFLHHHRQDSSQFRLFAGLRIYTADPMSPDADLNPDGVTGKPSVSLMAGPGFTESSGDGSVSLKTELTWPVSKRLSFHSSYSYYSKPRTLDIDQASFGVTYYAESSPQEQPFLNPDGPMGVLLLQIETGGGSRGWFSELGVGFPFDQHWTIHSNFRYTKDDKFSRQILTVTFGLSLYPGSVFTATH